MNFFEDVQDVIERAIAKAGKPAQLARAVGMSESTFSRWKRGSKNISLDSVAAIMDYMGVNLSHVYTPKMSDGTPGLIGFDQHIFPDLQNTFLLYVRSPAMEPTIREKDIVLVHPPSRDLVEGRVFTIRLGADVLLRRAYRTQEQWVLRPDNREYPEIVMAPRGVEIIGRVVWKSSDKFS